MSGSTGLARTCYKQQLLMRRCFFSCNHNMFLGGRKIPKVIASTLSDLPSTSPSPLLFHLRRQSFATKKDTQKKKKKKKKEWFRREQRERQSLRDRKASRWDRTISKERKKENSENEMLPAVCVRTGSPHVYVAGIALEDTDVDAKTIFQSNNDSNDEGGSLLSDLSSYSFEYFPPASFQNFQPTSILLRPDSSLNNTSKHPNIHLPEVAFLGRSNVGKSSLINALMKKNLAKCSKHPGRTQQEYYYGLVPNPSHNGKREDGADPRNPYSSMGFMVDLPGFGFAKAPEKVVEEWQSNTQSFLCDRRDAGTLQRLFLLIDARRDMASTFEQSIMAWFDEADIPYTIVLTKSDSATRPHIIKTVNQVCWRYHRQILMSRGSSDNNDNIEDAGLLGPMVHITSAKNGDGIFELMSSIEAEFVHE